MKGRFMEIKNNIIRQKINMREIYRYLGYGANVPDETVKSTIEEIIDSLTRTINPKHVYKLYTCKVLESTILLRDNADIEQQITFQSKNLSYNLMQCSQVALLAATLGIEADKLLQRYEVLNMAKAAIVQACGAACIEAYCDILQENICKEASAHGKKLYLRPRFSPGYGDLPLENQTAIFRALECTKRIGLTLTESFLMYPTKSVTAFIGMTANPLSCHIDKCKDCDFVECEFRKEET